MLSYLSSILFIIACAVSPRHREIEVFNTVLRRLDGNAAVAIKDFGNPFGIGLVALKDIYEGEAVLFIPLSHVVTTESILKEIPDLRFKKQLSDRSIL
eukprot:UC4_evm1s1367